MTMIRAETAADTAARERLLDKAFGKTRRRKTSERLREGRLPSEGLAFTAVDAKGKLAGTIRLWDVVAGSAGRALFLGPLAVDCGQQGKGIGAALMRHAMAEAKRLGHAAIILVGDAPYYARFGFTGTLVADLHLPGPVDRARFLGVELIPGALDGAEGLVAGCGRLEALRREAA
ncbi:GNAT family N-acetyltransferase [Aestuariivirga sp.]|uniref:GNAT family N-acetyltransferase n=1 Tax=Aestuariivirga sp. TaxID=2650926 RepID=UPI0025C23ED9|nr:N-acetyltransferase [Aestuariivirga sp.]MCA3555368.1 N-acetyltransferase [Aestuariivirga sp.]